MRKVYVHRDDLRKWQLATLDIQQALQSVFEKKEIPYWCGGGTLIAAIRDKRFIYWDNDLDTFFLYKDYKRILVEFWKAGLAHNYDIYCHNNGYWQKKFRLNELLKNKKLDERKLNLEVSEMSINMFKVFSKKPVRIKLYTTNQGDPENYVPVNQYSKHHMTSTRMAYHCDDIEDGAFYNALPDVCMLPMVEIEPGQYVLSSFLYIVKRILSAGHSFLNRYEDQIHKQNDYTYHLENNVDKIAPFERINVDSTGYKISLMFKNGFRCLKLLKPWGRSEKDFIAYRTEFFRYQVTPYLKSYIFPLKKLRFEGKCIYVPNKPEKILSLQFGNFMKIPDEKYRIALPFFCLDRMD